MTTIRICLCLLTISQRISSRIFLRIFNSWQYANTMKIFIKLSLCATIASIIINWKIIRTTIRCVYTSADPTILMVYASNAFKKFTANSKRGIEILGFRQLRAQSSKIASKNWQMGARLKIIGSICKSDNHPRKSKNKNHNFDFTHVYIF